MSNLSPQLQTLVRQTDLPDIIQQINAYWEDEQRRRAVFIEELTPNDKKEFINGEIVVHSPARNSHLLVTRRLSTLLIHYCYRKQLGEVYIEKALLRFVRNNYEPDICFFPKSIADTFSPEQLFFPPPALVVEVLSPSTEERDRTIKFEDYAHHGVQEYWILDADQQRLERYFLSNGSYVLQPEADSIISQVMPGLQVPLDVIWSEAKLFQVLAQWLQG